jgi:hypothetical protein
MDRAEEDLSVSQALGVDLSFESRDRVILAAEVDRLRAQVAAVESVLEEGDHGLYCGSHFGGGHCNCWHAKVAKITGYGYE